MTSKQTVIALPVFLFATVLGQIDPHTKATVSPQRNQTVPDQYEGSITFSCSVQGNTSPWVIWTIGGAQIRNSEQFDGFAAENIIFDPPSVGANYSTITISSVQTNNFTRVQCQAEDDNMIYPLEENSSFFVITFDAPSRVIDLVLLPSLSLEWNKPSEPPFPEVSIDYTIEINATEEDGMNLKNFTLDTSLSVQFLEELLHDLGSECVEFEFFVSANNDAGTGPLARIKDTVPISPDVRNVSRDLRVTIVDVQSQTALILFPPVMPCSVNFSLTNYTININGAVHRTLTPEDVMPGVPLTISNLAQDVSSSLTVTACNSVTCRTSDQRTLNTTDVQTVQAVFFQNRLFLQCSFATNSQAQGCVFSFTRSIVNASGTDRYNVTREEGFMCVEAPYRRDAYGDVLAMDWEESGEVGSVALPITNIVMNVSTLEEFTNLTRCPETPEVQGIRLSGGAVGGIVSGIIAVGIAVVVTIVIVTFILIKVHKKRAELKLKDRQPESRVGSDSSEVVYGIELETKGCKEEMEKYVKVKNKGDEETSESFEPGESVTLVAVSRLANDSEEMSEIPVATTPPPPSVQEETLQRNLALDTIIDMPTGSPSPPAVTEESTKPSAHRVVADSGDILEDVHVVSMSAGPPPPPPISGDISSTGVIEMPEPRVGFDHDSPEESDDEVMAESEPLLKAVEKRVKQELDKRIKQELDRRVKQELDKQVKEELDKRVTQKLDERVKQEIRNELTEEIDKRVRLEDGDSGAPLTLKVQWKSLIESLLRRGGNKDYNFSKLKVELEF